MMAPEWHWCRFVKLALEVAVGRPAEPAVRRTGTPIERRLGRSVGNAGKRRLAWVDVYAYALFRRPSDKAPPELVWDSERVWAHYLKLLAFAVG